MITTARVTAVTTLGLSCDLLIEDNINQLKLQPLISNVGLWAEGKERPEKYLYQEITFQLACSWL